MRGDIFTLTVTPLGETNNCPIIPLGLMVPPLLCIHILCLLGLNFANDPDVVRLTSTKPEWYFLGQYLVIVGVKILFTVCAFFKVATQISHLLSSFG